MSTIVRVFCPTGIIRISLPADSMLSDLMLEIKKRTNIPLEKQELYIPSPNHPKAGGYKICTDVNVKLSDVGIVHGTIINLNSDQPVEFLNTSRETTPTQDAKFKSFDSFLSERGYNISDLPLKNNYLPVKIQVGKMNKIPSSISLKHQPYRHVDHLEIMNSEEMKNFANFWMHDCEMLTQRCGWMYGYYIEDLHYPLGIRAVCEAIYEPTQSGNVESVRLEPDDFLPVVDTIAERLGLERIGVIFSHLPRENFFLTAQEIYDIARIQNSRIDTGHYSGYNASHHVTCTISPDVNKVGECSLNVFMISDLGMALVRDGIIEPNQEDPLKIHLVKSQECVIYPAVLEEGVEVSSFDTSWVMVRVNESAPIKPNPYFKNSLFQRENRGKQPNARSYFMQAKGSNCNVKEGFDSHVLFSDFHLLLYIAQKLTIDDALAICDCIVNEEPINNVIREILTS